MREIVKKVVKKTMEMDYNVDKKGDWDWGAGVALYGLRRYYEKTRDTEVLSYIRKFADDNMKNAKISFTVNTTAPLLSLILLYKETGEKIYLDFCEDFARWLVYEAPRTPGGELEHTVINVRFDGEIWVDTIFMAGVFLTQMGRTTKNNRYLHEGIKQARMHIQKLQDRKNGLLYHGYSYKSGDFMSGCLWARGNSWLTISVPEIFDDLEGYDDKNFICEGVRKQVEGLAPRQQANGLWPTVLTDPLTYCETSASAGFVYGILRGIRLGYLKEDLKACASKGYEAVTARIMEDGIVSDVSAGTGVQPDIPSYNNIPRDRIMPWGQGIALLMLCEDV